MIDPIQLKDEVIIPVLDYLNLNSEEAVQLLLGTAAQESAMGRYLAQISGPARGIWQMEPATEMDIWENYIAFRGELMDKIRALLMPHTLGESQLPYNLPYACAMARLHYRRAPERLPNDIQDMAALWKLRYNTPQGKGTEDEFVANYYRYVLGGE